MGYYIEMDHPLFKADQLIKETGCGEWLFPFRDLDYDAVREDGLVPVVVMNNGPFDAAGIAYNQREYEEFTEPTDTRPKRVLLMKIEDVLARNPYVESELRGTAGR